MTSIDTTALRTGAVVFDVTGRGNLVVSGKERVSFLQGLLTNDLRTLKSGSGCAALLLTPKGKLRATLTVLVLEESLVLDTEPELASPLEEALRGYILYPPVDLVDTTAETAVLHVEGPRASDLLATDGISPVPEAEHSHLPFSLEGTRGLVVAASRAGETGFDLRFPRGEAHSVMAELTARGATIGTAQLLDGARIEAGIPRWGAELDGSVLPDEAGLQRTAISYTKGCYVGQETVARIRTYGHVNRILVQLLLPPDAAPAPGDPVLATENDGRDATGAGRIVDAISSVHLSRGVAFAWVKREFAGSARLTVSTQAGPVPADVSPLPAGHRTP